MSNTVNSVGNISFRNHIHGIFTTSNNHLLIDRDLDSNYRVTDLRGALFTDGTSVPLSLYKFWNILSLSLSIF